MTSSFRHGVTITGTVLLVTGTLCFAWWSDGETAILASNTTMAEPESRSFPVTPAAHTSSNTLLSNAGTITIPSYEEATSCIHAENAQLFPPNHFVNLENLPPLYETLTGHDWRPGCHKRSLSDSALLRNLHHQQLDHRDDRTGMTVTPPPSYEKINDHVT